MRVPRLAWLLLALAFAALEGIALLNGIPGDTFSDLVWSLLEAAPVLAVPLVGFLGWLTWHFVEPTVRRGKE